MADTSKKWATLTIKVSPELIERIQSFADDSGLIRSTAARLLIGMGLESKYDKSVLLTLIDNAQSDALLRLDRIVGEGLVEIKDRYFNER